MSAVPPVHGAGLLPACQPATQRVHPQQSVPGTVSGLGAWGGCPLGVKGWGQGGCLQPLFPLFPTSVARYLANDMEEDLEDPKSVIFLWALGQDWRHQVSDFLHQRDKLWARMGFRAVVRRQSCQEVSPPPASQGGAKRLAPPPPAHHPLFSCRSWPRSRRTGPGLGSGAPTMAGLKGASQRPRSPSPGAPASRHPTVLFVPCPLIAGSAACAPCLSYPSAFPTMLSGSALHPKLGPGVGASLLSCPPSCDWSQAPTPSTVSRGQKLEGSREELGGRCGAQQNGKEGHGAWGPAGWGMCPALHPRAV